MNIKPGYNISHFIILNIEWLEWVRVLKLNDNKCADFIKNGVYKIGICDSYNWKMQFHIKKINPDEMIPESDLTR